MSGFLGIQNPTGNANSLPPDNKFKTIDFGYSALDLNIGALNISKTINELPEVNNSDYKTIAEDEIVRFIGIVVPYDRSPVRYFDTYHLEGKGKGVYGINGDVNVIESDLLLYNRKDISEITIPDLEILITGPNAVLINLGEIANADLLDTLNAANPTYNITAGENWYFELTRNDKRFVYSFIGNAGEYGLNQNQFINSDLLLLFAEDTDLSAPEKFIATQGQTVFNLLTTPLNVDVTVDRLPQIETTDYTLIDNTITLLEALDAGSIVVIRKF
ncbi:hypothetical protein [Lacinutrix sp. Hel_I_90]|uniref:hypothetical protein n=1 Tax=Lacinutrix sp. Hel_I_90 TaxID=1249999 RepID=UPI0005CAA542|nr:hypothetical protein [Lacinutrix sp. Hel_I_90]